MRQIRIAMTSMPDELHDLSEGPADQPDLALLALASSEVDLLLEATRVDVVVVAMRHGEMPAVAARRLDEYPRVGVVGVDIKAGTGAVIGCDRTSRPYPRARRARSSPRSAAPPRH